MDKEWVKNVPVIALTANAVSGVKQMLLKEGFNDYITKPLSVDKLEKCLLRYLSRTDILPADND
jgi:CheY-like chemotaxis protein